MAVLIFLPSSVSSKLDRQSHQLLWQAVAKKISHIRFCRPNARWLSLLDDFVTKNFGTRSPVPPGAKFWRRHWTEQSQIGNWVESRDQTKLSCLVASCVYTADTDKTRQFCLVCVGGDVNKL